MVHAMRKKMVTEESVWNHDSIAGASMISTYEPWILPLQAHSSHEPMCCETYCAFMRTVFADENAKLYAMMDADFADGLAPNGEPYFGRFPIPHCQPCQHGSVEDAMLDCPSEPPLSRSPTPPTPTPPTPTPPLSRAPSPAPPLSIMPSPSLSQPRPATTSST